MSTQIEEIIQSPEVKESLLFEGLRRAQFIDQYVKTVDLWHSPQTQKASCVLTTPLKSTLILDKTVNGIQRALQRGQSVTSQLITAGPWMKKYRTKHCGPPKGGPRNG